MKISKINQYSFLFRNYSRKSTIGVFDFYKEYKYTAAIPNIKDLAGNTIKVKDVIFSNMERNMILISNNDESYLFNFDIVTGNVISKFNSRLGGIILHLPILYLFKVQHMLSLDMTKEILFFFIKEKMHSYFIKLHF